MDNSFNVTCAFWSQGKQGGCPWISEGLAHRETDVPSCEEPPVPLPSSDLIPGSTPVPILTAGASSLCGTSAQLWQRSSCWAPGPWHPALLPCPTCCGHRADLVAWSPTSLNNPPRAARRATNGETPWEPQSHSQQQKASVVLGGFPLRAVLAPQSRAQVSVDLSLLLGTCT